MRFNSYLKTNIFLVFLLTFLLVLNMGGAFSAHIMTDGEMSPCPYMGMDSICNMTPLAHLSGWQSMFTVTSQGSVTLLLLLSLSVLIIWLFNKYLLKPPQTFSKVFSRYKYEIEVFNHLQLAFTQGLIHSKAY
jgi:hypothetical protein